jgi:putative heme-binding domain-containing protein
LVLCVVGGFMLAVTAGAQAQRNPRADDPAAVRAGAAMYRERCAECHGDDAKGVRGPDLTRLWTSEASDARVFQTIRQGVAGSIMPLSTAPDDEIWAISAYLRSISTTAAGAVAAGNAANGEKIFWASCGGCHHVRDRGGRLGPELTRIGASLSPDALRAAIRTASAAMTAGYEPVTIVTREGQRIRGARKSEDAYSIQIMDTRERLQGFVKSDLREVKRDSESLMPSFGPDKVNDRDLDDVVAFLVTLRSEETPRRGRP